MAPPELPLSAAGIALGLMMALSWIIIGWVWWVNRRYESPKWEKLLTFVVTIFGAERFFRYGLAFVLMLESHLVIVEIDKKIGPPVHSTATDLGMELPGFDGSGTITLNQASFKLKADDSIWRDGQPVSIEEIGEILKEEKINLLVMDVGEHHDFESSQAFVDFLNAATRVGITNVTLAGLTDPDMPKPKPLEERTTTIEVRSNGSIWHGGREVTLEEFQEILVAEKADRFRLRAAKDLPTERIKEIVRAAADADVVDVIFGGRPKED